MKTYWHAIIALLFLGLVIYSFRGTTNALTEAAEGKGTSQFDGLIRENAQQMIEEGRRIFRFDTFGDEAFWGDTLQLHQAIAGAKLGGVGPGWRPKTALAVGLKVDMDAHPRRPRSTNKSEAKSNLDDPATTLALLKLNAVARCHRLL